MKYQEGLETTKNWLKDHSRLEIEDILSKAGLSSQKAKIILTKYCEEHRRDRASYDLGMCESSYSHKHIEALCKIKSVLKFLGFID